MRLHADLDVDVPEPLNGIVSRLLDTSAAIVRKRCVATLPESVLIDSIILMSQFLYDQGIGQRSNAWIRSGAMDICRPWIRRRGGVMDRE